MFRPDAPPLLENWLWLPVAYHGRAGTVVVSGTPIVRPAGQIRNPAGGAIFAPTGRLDIELELGFVLGGTTRLGETVPTSAAADHIFGVVLLNDWSARDIQAWEYVPLGPNLGKSFASSVSAWVLPIEALEDARVMHPAQTDPVPLPYLESDQPWGLDLDLEVWLQPTGQPEPVRVTAVNASTGIYWTAEQQLAHMTVNGATVRSGDFFGSGTISGSSPGELGSLIEMTFNGTKPLKVGETVRTFLEDGDRVILRGSAGTGSDRVYLGEVDGTVVEVLESGAM
jgi:fumarylacetoacetase